MHEFYLLDLDYVVENEKPVLRLFGRIGKKSAVVFYRGFQPYFYVLADGLEKAKKRIEKEPMQGEGRSVLPLSVEIVGKKILNRPCQALKVTLNNPRDVPAYREFLKNLDEVDDIREYDIPFVRRFLIDSGITPFKKIKVSGREVHTQLLVDIAIEAERLEQGEGETGIENFNVLSFDIEVYNPEGSPRPDSDPVIMASFSDLSGWEKVLSTRECGRDFVEVVKDEAALIKRICEVIRERDADIIVTYNGDAFDFEYLKGRAERNKVKLDLGRDGNALQFLRRGRFNCARMKGRVHVDMYHLVFNIIRRTVSLPTYTLSALGAKFLGMEDWDIEGEMWKMWDSDKDRQLLADYSRLDAIATIRLAREFTPLQVEFAKLIRESLFDITRMTSGQLVEWLLMNKAFERGEIAPNRPKFDEKSERYEMGAYKGAYVREPLKGLQENLAVFDFRSLYPSIIVTFNVDPSMLDAKCEKKHDSPTGHWFCAEETGFIPEILKDLIERRSEVKKKLKPLKKGDEEYTKLDAQQYALKLLSNSFYGFYGYGGARWYSRECAESITAWGRQYIQETFKQAEEAGFTVVYGDSIASDRFVPIKNGQGLVEIKNIEKLFEESAGKTIRADGKEIATPSRSYALSADPKTGKPVWSKIEAVIRHRTSKEMFRVSQKYGETIVTQDHSLIVRGEGGYEEKKPVEVAGKELACLRQIPAVGKLKKIDLYELLKDYSRKKQYKGRWKLAKVSTDGKWVWFGWMERKKRVLLKRHVIVGSKECTALCTLAGAYVAEGSSSTAETTTTRHGASISTSDRTWLSELKKCYHLLFDGAKAAIIRSAYGTRKLTYTTASGKKTVEYEDGTHKLQMMNGISAVFFKMLCGQKSSGKRIPSFAYHLPLKMQKILLENMVRGDGYRTTDKRYTKQYKKANFKYETKSFELACGLSFLLSQMGVGYTIRRRQSKQTYILQTSSKFNKKLWTKVKEEDYADYVYDLQVKGSHMFVDSCGLLLLHNTDSLFVKSDDVRERAEKFLKELNESLPGIMSLELEGFYKRGVFVTKKRYALIDDAGKITTKGLEVVRRDWAKVAKDTQQKVIRTVLEGHPEKAKDIVKKVIADLKGGKTPLEDVVVYTQMVKELDEYKQEGRHVAAARKALADGRKIGKGSVIAYIICRGPGSISDRSKPVNLVKPGEYDADYYIENQVLPPVMRILESLGYSESDMIGGQRKLLEF